MFILRYEFNIFLIENIGYRLWCGMKVEDF